MDRHVNIFLNDPIKLVGPFNYHVDDSIIQLNHYVTKSNQELLRKINRGRVTTFIKKMGRLIS